MGRNPFPKHNLHPAEGKSSHFSAFFGDFMRWKGKETLCVTLRWGRLRRLGGLAHARQQFCLPRGANTTCADTVRGYARAHRLIHVAEDILEQWGCPFGGGGFAASVASLTRGNSFVYREARTAKIFERGIIFLFTARRERQKFKTNRETGQIRPICRVCYILLFTSATFLFREWAPQLVGGKGKSCRKGRHVLW